MSEILTVIVEQSGHDRIGVHWFSSSGLALPVALEAARAVERNIMEQMVRAEVQRLPAQGGEDKTPSSKAELGV